MTSTLNDRLGAIGFRIAGASGPASDEEVDLERTLLEATREVPRDARLASLLFSWVQVHGEFVIVEKLHKLARQQERAEPGSTTWLVALAAFAREQGDHRWKKLLKRPESPVYLFPKEVTDSAVQMNGSVDWLAKVNFIVPAPSLRIREEDVLTPLELIQRNRQYRNRCLYGPSWRADIASAMERGLQRPSAIARAVGCSYEPAYRVSRQLRLLQTTQEGPFKASRAHARPAIGSGGRGRRRPPPRSGPG